MATRHGSATVAFPSDHEVLLTRKFDAPAALVFDVLTRPEHVRLWYAARPLNVCEIDLRPDGRYHFEGFIMADDVTPCSFRGTYREIERPTRTVETWVFDGRPRDVALETVPLTENDGVTTMTILLAFQNQTTRDSSLWTAPDGVHAADGGQLSYDRMEDLLATLA